MIKHARVAPASPRLRVMDDVSRVTIVGRIEVADHLRVGCDLQIVKASACICDAWVRDRCAVMLETPWEGVTHELQILFRVVRGSVRTKDPIRYGNVFGRFIDGLLEGAADKFLSSDDRRT